MAETPDSDALEQRVVAELRRVTFPGMTRDIVSFGFVQRIEVSGDGEALVRLRIPTHNPGAGDQIRDQIEKRLATIDGLGGHRVEIEVAAPRQAQQKAIAQDSDLLPGVRHVVAVASGKGGVGKSTVGGNLAVRLGQLGHRTGLLDADIYGPSVPMMFGIDDKPRVEAGRLLPFERYGIRIMSLGFVLDVDTPVIWRGPMVMKALEQLMGDVRWGDLDYLIVDLPPGTGDAQLTLTQKVPMSGAVIVTTPQDVALIDARKGLAMFRKVNVPVLGIVENMSGFVCPHCGEETAVFKAGGGERTAEALGVEFLGKVPLDPAVMSGGDAGRPVVAEPEEQAASVHREVFAAIAEAVVQGTESRKKPSLRIL